jgi:hypothetical protein
MTIRGLVQCWVCGCPIEYVEGAGWTVTGTDTTADGLTFCPPDPDREPTGVHEPERHHDGQPGLCSEDCTHHDAIGTYWADKTCPRCGCNAYRCAYTPCPG